jgi:CheY-like chemotaxis protein
MRYLIVDDSPEFRRQLAGLLRSRQPEAQIDEWDPRLEGYPAQALARERYTAVFMDVHPAGEDGIAWLKRIRTLADPPPVLLVADQGDPHDAIAAMKAGAADRLRRNGLDSARLARSLDDALREHELRRMERTGTYTPFERTVPIEPQRIGAPVAGDAVAIQGYHALRKIAEGGMARVYLAERESDGLTLVLKVLDPSLRDSGTFLRRFEREYRLIAALENEYVVRVYDFGLSGAHPYIAMEYLSGGTLAARMHEGMTSLAALRLTAQIARALDAIHSQGIIHRDLKPQNIMFRDTGRPVIVDFGLAKDLDSSSDLTRQGEVMATPRYMSPEQCLGQAADARSDLYSLGAIFYEMLTGKRLYGDAGPAELVYLHVHGPVPQLPTRLAGYQTILDRLLAKRPGDRFRSALELFATIAI